MAIASWMKPNPNAEALNIKFMRNETVADAESRFETDTIVQKKVCRMKQNHMSGHNLSLMESLASCFVRMIAEFDRALLNRELLRRR